MNPKRIKSTRFDNLPDEVLEHIFSFLLIKDLARVGCVSKGCSKLYLSTPSLSLDESSIASISKCDQRKQLLGSLETFLIRRGCNKLQCFRFSRRYHDHDQGNPESSCPKDLKSWMVKFVDYVVRCNVEELHLNINIDDTQKACVGFPIVRCKSLRHLCVKGMLTDIGTTLSSSFPELERLELTLVYLPDEKIFEWISHSCKCIKELRLEDVYGLEGKNATIESSSLKLFTFYLRKDYRSSNYNLYVACENLEEACIHLGAPIYKGKYDGALCFSAPNLKKLKWSGYVMLLFQNLGEFKRLEKAEIELDSKVKDFDNVSKLFSSLDRVEHLVLTEMTLMCLLRPGKTSAKITLHHVCYLRIHRLSLKNDHEVPALASVLEGMPNLETLVIEGGTNAYESHSLSFGRGYWNSQKLDLTQLKEVTIELSKGSNGVSLTRYLLDNVLNLQKLIIHHLPEQSHSVRKYKWNVISDAKVMFHVRNVEQKCIDDVLFLSN